jgi:hypothetical protein
MHIRPARAFWPSPRSRLSCQRRDQVISWLNRPRAGSSIGAARRDAERIERTRVTPQRPQAGPPPPPTPAPEPARDLRPSIRDMIERRVEQSRQTRSWRAGPMGFTSKKGAFNRGATSAHQVSRKDHEGCSGQHRHPPCYAQPKNDVWSASIERCKRSQKKRSQLPLCHDRKTIGRAVCLCSSLFGAVEASHIRTSLIYLDTKR